MYVFQHFKNLCILFNCMTVAVIYGEVNLQYTCVDFSVHLRNLPSMAV